MMATERVWTAFGMGLVIGSLGSIFLLGLAAAVRVEIQRWLGKRRQERGMDKWL
jgi:hypothetical protein